MKQTDCNLLPTDQIEIFQVKNKPVIVSETKTEISSNAGFLVLGAIDRKMKLIDSLTSCFQDGQKKRLKSVSDEDRIEHSFRDLLCQRVYQMAWMPMNFASILSCSYLWERKMPWDRNP